MTQKLKIIISLIMIGAGFYMAIDCVYDTGYSRGKEAVIEISNQVSTKLLKTEIENFKLKDSLSRMKYENIDLNRIAELHSNRSLSTEQKVLRINDIIQSGRGRNGK